MNLIRRLIKNVATHEPQESERGQVLVIFAGAFMLFLLLMALVIDIGWYWSNDLKIQRAADAAALAGAVYLPGDYATANSVALAAAKLNGYTNGGNTTIVTNVDSNNSRQLDVTINTKVSTYFLQVVGMRTLDASRSSKAEFILPVPMGSPQNYYGVGGFLVLGTPTITTNYVNPSAASATPPTGWAAPAAIGPSVWLNPANAYTSNNGYATDSTNNHAQIWKTFTFGALQSGAVIDGVQLGMELKDSAVNCGQVKAEISWNAGVTWSNAATVIAPTATTYLTKSDVMYTLGSKTSIAAWGNNNPSWDSTDFSSTNFQVRLTNLRPSCGTVSLDQLSAAVYSHTNTAGTPTETIQPIKDPNNNALDSQGFWGAVITKGGDRTNGDQFDPSTDQGSANPDYNGLGVDYTVVITGTNGLVKLFDPTFCETGLNSSGSGHYGTGDHWIGGSPNGVTTTYTLFNENGTPYTTKDDTQVATSGNLFANEVQADYSGTMGTPTSGRTDCSTISNTATGGYWHNKWWQLTSGLPAGTYRLNVSTDTGNASTNAENTWSLWVSSTGTAQVHGQGTMVAYTNLLAGTTLFYLAQIDKVHAGKTMEINLFDPDSMTGTLRIQSPNGNVYNYVNFSWTATNGQYGNNVSSIPITPNGFNDELVTITIPLPTTYGSGGLTPLGETQSGWWKIEYNVNAGNDTTTWAVDIRGNPVHLNAP